MTKTKIIEHLKAKKDELCRNGDGYMKELIGCGAKNIKNSKNTRFLVIATRHLKSSEFSRYLFRVKFKQLFQPHKNNLFSSTITKTSYRCQMNYKTLITIPLLVSVAFAIPYTEDDVATTAKEFIPKTTKKIKKDFNYWDGAALNAYYDKEYKKAAEAWKKATALAPNEGLKISSMKNYALALDNLGKHKEAAAAYDTIYKKYKNSTGESYRGEALYALFNKGYVMGSAGDYKEEIATYDKLYAEFGDMTDEQARLDIASALFDKAYRLDFLGKRQESIAVCDKIINEFGYSKSESILTQVAKAYVSKGYSLGHMKRYEESLTVYDEMIAEFGNTASENIKAELSIGMTNRSWTLGELGRYEEEIVACDGVIKKFDDELAKNSFYSSENMEIVESQIVNALVDKAFALGKLGRQDEEMALCDVIIDRYKNSKNQKTLEAVAFALSNKGVAVEKKGQNEEAERLYLEAIRISPSDIENGAYTNLFELYVIENKEIDKNVEKQFLSYAKANKKALLQYQMALTVKASLSAEQSAKIAKLKKEFKGVGFDEWSWVEIERWSDTLKDETVKQRVKATILVFKNWDKN
jgi:tetratricopeptide (TPR) repeat protein